MKLALGFLTLLSFGLFPCKSQVQRQNMSQDLKLFNQSFHFNSYILKYQGYWVMFFCLKKYSNKASPLCINTNPLITNQPAETVFLCRRHSRQQPSLLPRKVAYTCSTCLVLSMTQTNQILNHLL